LTLAEVASGPGVSKHGSRMVCVLGMWGIQILCGPTDSER